MKIFMNFILSRKKINFKVDSMIIKIYNAKFLEKASY